MPALDKIQRDFCQSILGQGSHDFIHHIKKTALSKEAVLRIYHHNIFSVHIKALENNYPLLFSLIVHHHGHSAARAMGQAFVEVSFPCTGSLEDWGGGLMAFLQRYEPLAEMPYLLDIAQYEWAKHLAYCSIENPLLTIEETNQLVGLGQDEPVFHFQNSSQLMAFTYNLKGFVDAHTEGQVYQPSQDDHPINSYALIVKNKGIVQVYWLTPALFVFLNRLKENQGVEVAFAAAQVLEPTFDAQEAFVFLLTNPFLQSA